MPFKPGVKKKAGRTKGVPNKTTQKLKDAILTAATLAGGGDDPAHSGLEKYLRRLAIIEPVAFCHLLGKVLPIQVKQSTSNQGPMFAIIAGMDPRAAQDVFMGQLKTIGGLDYLTIEHEPQRQVEKAD